MVLCFLPPLIPFTQSLIQKKTHENVYIDFEDSRVIDHSAIKAIDKLAERYQKEGKIHLMHSSEECTSFKDC